MVKGKVYVGPYKRPIKKGKAKQTWNKKGYWRPKKKMSKKRSRISKEKYKLIRDPITGLFRGSRKS